MPLRSHVKCISSWEGNQKGGQRFRREFRNDNRTSFALLGRIFWIIFVDFFFFLIYIFLYED